MQVESSRRWRRWLKKQATYVDGLCSTIPAGKSVIDLGAGCGHFVRALRERGYDAKGCDATEGIWEITNGLVQQVDLAGDCSTFYDHTDWALFLEVGEHVPMELEQQLIDNVSRIPREGLIVSWATTTRKSYGHVNCRPPEHVVAELAARGWVVDEEATAKLKEFAPRNVKRNVRVFGRKP